MDVKKHKFITLLIGVLFLLAIMTNTFIILPEARKALVAVVLVLVFVWASVWTVKRYKQRLR